MSSGPWAFDNHDRADLVRDALRLAIALRRSPPAKVSFHADQGTQMCSAQHTKFATDHSIVRTMGHSICDNPIIWSVFATLKAGTIRTLRLRPAAIQSPVYRCSSSKNSGNPKRLLRSSRLTICDG